MPICLGSRPTFSCFHPRSSRYISFATRARRESFRSGISNATSRERQPPAQGTRDDDALRDAEECPAEEQNCDRRLRIADEAQREQVESAGCSGDEQPGHDPVFGAFAVGEMAGPHPRDQCGCELAACDKSNDERTEAEP